MATRKGGTPRKPKRTTARPIQRVRAKARQTIVESPEEGQAMVAPEMIALGMVETRGLIGS
ncbi:MAG TPA: hypothetical protein VF478_01115, partial [Anaerolineae bacterium]